MQGERSKFDSASVLSKAFAVWLYPTVREAARLRKTQFKEENLMPLPEIAQGETYFNQLEGHWVEESKLKEPNLMNSIMKTFWKPYLVGVLLSIIVFGCQLANAELQARIIATIGDSETPLGIGIVFVVFLLVSSIISCLCLKNAFFYLQSLSVAIKQSLLKLLYAKIQKVSIISKKGAMKGKIINVAGSDLEIFDNLFLTSFIFACPFLWIGGGIMLWFKIGGAGLVGLFLTLLYGFLSSFIYKLMAPLKFKVNMMADERLRLISNLVEGMRIVKMYSWEAAFYRLIFQIRSDELKIEYKRNSMRGISLMLFVNGHAITQLVTFAVYNALGNEMVLSDVFAAVSILAALHLFTVGYMMYGISSFFMILISIKRLTQVLTSYEVMPKHVDPGAKLDGSIRFKRAEVSWNIEDVENSATESELLTNQSSFKLFNIHFKIKPGNLCVVVGAVGSGKSSLLMSLLGELNIIRGRIDVKGSLAYVEQEPWITSATFKENVVMGSKFDQQRYDMVIEACKLQSDIEQFDYGSDTIIGERGMNLSGGQKARLALARAVYADKDIYLLDDPLSAVDSKVSSKLFNRCILETLKDKTRVLVTHQLQYLPKADMIIVLHRGTIAFRGTYEDLRSNPECMELVGEIVEHTEGQKPAKQPTEEDKVVEEPKQTGKDSKTIIDEERAQGSIPASFFFKFIYFSFNSVLYLVFLFVFLCAAQVSYLSISYWLSIWASQMREEQDNVFYIKVFAALSGLCLFFGYTRSVLLSFTILRAGKSLFGKALHAVIHTKSEFFDSNPIGRILNRFSRDVFITDELVMMYLSDTIQSTFILISMVIVIIIIQPINLVPMFAIICYLVFIKWYVGSSAREVRRLEQTSRSPVFTTLSSTIAGLPVIRCFGWSEFFMKKFDGLVLVSIKASYSYSTLLYFFFIYIDLGSVLMISCNALILVLLRDTVDPQTSALSLSFTSLILVYTAWFFRTIVETENFMSSPQRLQEYANLTGEIPENSNVLKVTAGEVVFDNVKMKYREHSSEFALNGVSFTIKPGYKVGIVGRTGAGKSSLMQAMFRLVSIESGRILLDGTDISNVSLESLRNSISVIPQSPFLFTDSMRRNLDPFDNYSDADVWRVLDQVKLKTKVEEMEGGLSHALTSNSADLSVGEKQLVCLARALLKKSKILIMDEATANVDQQTDLFIQKQIRTYFRDITVITIAHRLQTIMDNDLIIVMKKGIANEVGSPLELIKDEASEFLDMIRATGADQARILIDGITASKRHS